MQNSTKPEITILMPVYNGAKYLSEAINSILNQTFTNYEFLIINDGSTDTSENIIKSFNDTRISYVKNEKNLGLIKTLNKGLDLAKGDYIARMDADDIAKTHRIKTQYNFLKKNPSIDICGCSFSWFGNKTGLIKRNESPEMTKVLLLFHCSITHVLLKKQALKEHNLKYDENILHAEDYDLWARSSKFLNLANCPEILMKYRWHNHNICVKNQNVQTENSIKIKLMQLQHLHLTPTKQELLLHERVSHSKTDFSLDEIKTISKWFLKIINANNKYTQYDSVALQHHLSKKFFWICFYATSLGKPLHKLFWESSLQKWSSISIKHKIEFKLRCLLKIKK